LNHLILNKLLNPAQHGFVPHRSCLSNLLETLDFITASLADGLNVDEVLLDFAKAFDLVPHRRLLHKLAGYGVSREILSWFEDFLSNRKQRVVVGEKMSEWSDVLSGVPQGSVLGPLFFVVYINDLPDTSLCEMKLFADDSKLLSVINNDVDVRNMQRDLVAVTEWTKQWGMRLNLEKCKVLHFGRNNPKASYILEDKFGQIKEIGHSNT